MNDTTTGRQAAAILAELGWPAGLPTEALVASVFGRAMRSGMFEAEVIMGFTFDRKECPAVVSRDDRLTVALHALCRFAADNGRLEDLRFDGNLVSDDVPRSDGWTCAPPRLPGMRGLYGAASRERNGAEAGTRAEWKTRNRFRAKRLSPPAGESGT